MMARILAFLLLTICAAAPIRAGAQADRQSELILALKELQKLDQRMNSIGYRLVAANAAYCNPVIGRGGLSLHDLAQYADQNAARLAFGLDGPIAVNAIAPDSPAEHAGMVAGDELLAINGTTIETIANNGAELAKEAAGYQRIAAVRGKLMESFGEGDVNLTIRRDGNVRDIAVTPVRSCPSQFQIRVTEDRKASADGTIVSVSSGLAEHFREDDEFAAVVAHELAHNLLRHRERLNAQKVNRGFFGQFGKSAGRIKQTEIEADRLSVWLMANAGYDPAGAIRFWARYGKKYGKGVFSASTHYRWKKRVKLFEEEIAKMGEMEPTGRAIAPPLLTGNHAVPK